MSSLRCLHCDPARPAQAAASLEADLADHVWVRLLASGVLPEASWLNSNGMNWPTGPGLVLSPTAAATG